MKLYENVVIGNFLYGLGFAVAHRVKRHNEAIPSVINLLQQTPDDTLIGDLFMRFPGVMRILEFKQMSNNSDKEEIRHKKVQTGIGKHDRWAELSRDVHWFVETAPQGGSFISRIVPYLDAYPRDSSRYDLAAFINATADAAVSGSRYTDQDFKIYLELLAICHKEGAGAVGSGGLVVKVNADGDLQYVALESITDLRLSLEEVVTRQQERHTMEQQRELERKLQLERNGPTMGR